MGNLKPGTLNNDTRLMALPHKKPAVAETGSTYNTIQTGKEGRKVGPMYPASIELQYRQHKWNNGQSGDMKQKVITF